MGCSVYARAIIGVKLPRAPYEEVKERGCKHPISKGKKFCGECGAKSWVSESHPLFDEDECKIGDFEFLEGGSCDDPDYYVGVCALETSDCMYGPPGVLGDFSGVDVGLLRCQLKALLEPIGLWEDNMQVGLWVFGFVSY